MVRGFWKRFVCGVINMTDYEKVYSFDNLYKAHLIARKGKRFKADVIHFEMNLAENLIKIQEALENRTYQMQGYYNFYVYEPKKRLVDASYYPDRVLQHCLCDEVFGPLLQKRLIYDNAACQVGKGTHFAMRRLSQFIRQHYLCYGHTGYFLKCDVRKYFPTIDHQVLKQRLKHIVKDIDVCKLLFHLIGSYHTEGQPGKGLPLGNQTSQWFSLLYLDRLDRRIKEKHQVKHYIRYMDDLCLIHQDKHQLKEILQDITQFIEIEMKQTFNSKTQIFPIKNGIEFLGFRFSVKKNGKIIKRLRVATKNRYKRRISKLRQDYQLGRITLSEVKNVLTSYRGHLKHGHTYQLQKRAMRRPF